ncbi:helix-turn-helix domain-containing protein [Rhodococcus sp. YL-1]
MDEERRNRCRTLLSEALTLVNDRPTSFSGSNIGSRLTRREREIAFAVSKGKSNVAIADDLFISVNTVRFHVRNTLRKLEASNRNEIAAMILGWVAAPASLPTRAISPPTPPIS